MYFPKISTPPPPWLSVIIQLGWVPSEKNICAKSLLHYIIMRKIIFCVCVVNEKKNFSFMLIRCLIISRTFLANNQPHWRYLTPLTTWIIPSAKKKNTYIQTTHHVSLRYFISVRTCWQEGLEHDQITVNQMCNKATARQPVLFMIHSW